VRKDRSFGQNKFMRLKIVQAGEPVLRETARALTVEEIRAPAMRELVAHMRETMRDAPGVGLAAPQVGLGIQLAVIEDRPEYMNGIPADALVLRERSAVDFFALFNPRIVEYSGETVEFFEGCLSVAGFSALAGRSHRVTVEYLDEQAEPRRIEAAGWFARILQHEIDHLNGRLYLDLMEPRTFSTVDNLTRHWKDVPTAALRDRLGIARR
jgi:peptide deformylase